jgi:hypothetical protein
MSPPLCDTESPNVATAPTKSKKAPSAQQLAANQANARLSRGPVTPEGKERSKYNARKHDLRAESPVLPGENAAELNRRLEVWPVLMNAATELEWFAAERAVHIGWRIERAERSEDAAAERVMIDLEKATEDRQAEEARLLVLELDSDLVPDPASVIRKLHRTPAGCSALLQKWTGLQSRIDHYGILFWSQREELFHLLGKRLRDLFTDDPVITRWVVTMMGAVFGDSEGDKAQEIGHILEGLRPDWMGEEEFGIRMRVLAHWLPGKQEAAARVSAYVAAAIADLNERLERARANSRHELELDLQSAWVDDTAAGARRTSYKLGHDRSFHATCRRLEALQKARRAGGETMADELDDEIEPAGAAVANAEAGPAVDPTADLPVTSAPISAPPDEAIVTVTNEPISPGTVECREEIVDAVRGSPRPSAGASDAFEWGAQARGMPPLEQSQAEPSAAAAPAPQEPVAGPAHAVREELQNKAVATQVVAGQGSNHAPAARPPVAPTVPPGYDQDAFLALVEAGKKEFAHLRQYDHIE